MTNGVLYFCCYFHRYFYYSNYYQSMSMEGCMMGMNYSYYSHRSDYHMQGRLLPRLLFDVHILVLYILPYFLTCFFGKAA